MFERMPSAVWLALRTSPTMSREGQPRRSLTSLACLPQGSISPANHERMGVRSPYQCHPLLSTSTGQDIGCSRSEEPACEGRAKAGIATQPVPSGFLGCNLSTCRGRMSETTLGNCRVSGRIMYCGEKCWIEEALQFPSGEHVGICLPREASRLRALNRLPDRMASESEVH
jgi:hypothetical protein